MKKNSISRAKVIAFVLAASMATFSLIYFWETNFVWVAVVVSILHVPIIKLMDKKQDIREVLLFSPTFWGSIVVAVVSTIIRYLSEIDQVFSAIIDLIADHFWEIVVFCICLFIVASILMAKKVIVKKITERKLKQEGETKRLLEIEKKQNELKKLQQIIEKEQFTIGDLTSFPVELVRKHVPVPFVEKLALEELVQVSHLKKKIHFKPNEIQTAILLFDNLFRICYKDELLKQIKEKFLFLESIKQYQGYKSLIEQIKENTHSEFQKFLVL